MTKNILVTLPNSRQGQGICDAFLVLQAKKNEQQDESYKIFGTTRSSEDSELLQQKGITPVQCEFGSAESFKNALRESQASVVVLITGDEFGPSCSHRKNKILLSQDHEFENAKILIDTCTEHQDQIDHLFFISLFACDEVPDSMTSYKAKHHIEHYLFQQMSVNNHLGSCFHYDIIRSGIPFEVMDGGRPMNALLKPGKLVGAFAPTVKIPYVSSLDVGKAVMAMLQDPDTWGSGQILHAISSIASGNDCALALTKAAAAAAAATSGRGGETTCKYQTVQNISLWLAGFGPFAKYFNQSFVNTHASQRQLEWHSEFLEVVPDPVSLETFFSGIGQWSNGTKFGAPPPTATSVVADSGSPFQRLNDLRKLVRPLQTIKIADESVEEPQVSDAGVPTDYAVIRTP